MKYAVICLAVSVLAGCASTDMITTANTMRAIGAITAESARAELIGVGRPPSESSDDPP